MQGEVKRAMKLGLNVDLVSYLIYFHDVKTLFLFNLFIIFSSFFLYRTDFCRLVRIGLQELERALEAWNI